MQDDRERIESLRASLKKALKRVGEVQGKSASGAEKEYGQIYQELVRLGAVPQIRKRYRVG